MLQKLHGLSVLSSSSEGCVSRTDAVNINIAVDLHTTHTFCLRNKCINEINAFFVQDVCKCLSHSDNYVK